MRRSLIRNATKTTEQLSRWNEEKFFCFFSVSEFRENFLKIESGWDILTRRKHFSYAAAHYTKLCFILGRELRSSFSSVDVG